MNPTLVFVHGAWHGVWCWEEHVAPAFRAEGYNVVVVTLPDHGNPGSSARMWSGVGSYVEEVRSELDSLDGEARSNVVLVGHSMGGLVVQRLMETEEVVGGVLVASMPRKGATGALVRLAKADPKAVLTTIASLSLWPLIERREQVRHLFFTDDASADDVEKAYPKLQNESFPAFLSMLTRWPRPSKVTAPIRVIAAEYDGVFTLAEQHDLAKAYGVTAAVIEGAGHDLMLDQRWPQLVSEIEHALDDFQTNR